MNETPIAITDPNCRIKNPEIEQMLSEYDAKKLAHAEKREEKRFAKIGKIDKILDIYFAIQNHFKQK